MVGVTTTWGTVLMGCRIWKTENYYYRRMSFSNVLHSGPTWIASFWYFLVLEPISEPPRLQSQEFWGHSAKNNLIYDEVCQTIEN